MARRVEVKEGVSEVTKLPITRAKMVGWMYRHVGKYHVALLIKHLRIRHNIPADGFLLTKDVRERLTRCSEISLPDFPLPDDLCDYVHACKSNDIFLSEIYTSCKEELLLVDKIQDEYITFLLVVYVVYGEIFTDAAPIFSLRTVISTFNFSNFLSYLEHCARSIEDDDGSESIVFTADAWREILSIVEPFAKHTPSAIAFNKGVSQRTVKEYVDASPELFDNESLTAYKKILGNTLKDSSHTLRANILIRDLYLDGLNTKEIQSALKSKGIKRDWSHIKKIISRAKKDKWER